MASFSGHWVNESESQSLTLDLFENGTHLTGKYCFITNDGNRIDCAEDNDRNINGIIKDNVGVVSLKAHLVVLVKQHYLLERILIFTINNDMPFINANMSAQSYIFQKSNAKYNKNLMKNVIMMKH
ncbi:hypothetical protein BANRA_05088 [Klebsiella pneumoniae]|nr:hypothetical protein BANRA_05088 [Klebsiella pneumoniae]